MIFETFQLSFSQFICAFHQEITSFFQQEFPFRYDVSSTDGKISVTINLLFYLFFHRCPIQVLMGGRWKNRYNNKLILTNTSFFSYCCVIRTSAFNNLAQWIIWVAQLVRAGEPGSNPDAGKNFSLKLLFIKGKPGKVK